MMRLAHQLGRLCHFHGRAQLLAQLRPSRSEATFGRRTLVVYKDLDLTDHQLYSLLRHLLAFADVSFVCFTPEERPRHDPGRSTDKLRQALRAVRPQLVLVYNNILSIEEVAEIKSMNMALVGVTCGVASFTWGAPPRVTQGDVIAAMREYDWYLVPHRPHVARLQAEGVKAAEFPLWFDRDWFRPLDLSARFDILFVGDVLAPLNRNRMLLLQALGRQFSLAIMSAGTIMDAGVQRIRPSTNPLVLNRVLNQSRIVLGSDRLANTETLNAFPGQYLFYTDDFFIRQRTYLALGAGACYAVESHPEVARKFSDGQEIILWRDVDDLRDRVRSLLDNHEQRQHIGRSGARRAHAEHTTQHRIRSLRALIGISDT